MHRRAVLTDPDGFFANASDGHNLRGAAVVVMGSGIASLIGPLFVFLKILDQFPAGTDPLVALGGSIAFVGRFLGVFLAWFAYAGVFYLVSRYFSRTGDFRAMFTAVGWGFLPALLGGLLASLHTVFVFSGLAFPPDPALARPFVSEVRQRPSFALVSSLGIAFTIWQAFVWSFGIKHAAEIDLREAVLVVSGPVLVAVALQLHRMT